VLRFTSDGACAGHVNGSYLQLGLGDTGGGGGGEVAVLAAHGVGGGGAGDEEAGEDGDGFGDGGHFDAVCCECLVVGLGRW
jgi:hypothetical protein